MLIDENGQSSGDLKLDNRWVNDFERGKRDSFKFTKLQHLGAITKLHIWRKGILEDKWFVEHVIVKHHGKGTDHVFPVHRWVSDDKLMLPQYDSCLPQHDERLPDRKHELDQKRARYQFEPAAPGLPPQVCETLFTHKSIKC